MFGLAAFGAGLLALGFALGQFVEASSHAREAGASNANSDRPAPAYSARATFSLDAALSVPLVLAPDSEEDLAAALAEQDAFRRAARLGSLLPALGPDAVPEMRSALEQAGEMNGVELSLLLSFWATHDPAEAATWAVYQSPMAYRVGAIVATIEPWARTDPQAAAKVVQQAAQLPGQDLSEVERALVRTWFESGQPGLETYIRDLGLTTNRQRALRTFFLNAVRRDGAEPAGQWAEAIPDEDKKFKIDAFRQLGSVLGQSSPPDAIAWCDAHCDGPFGGALRMVTAQQWALRDGAAAMEWVSQAPEGQERDVAVMGAFRGWARRDLEGLGRWLEQMDLDAVEPWFRPAVPAVAATFLQSRPAEAMAWAETIEDEQLREDSLVALAREWRKRDEQAAAIWIASSSLTTEARERAMGPAPTRGAGPPPAVRTAVPEAVPDRDG